MTYPALNRIFSYLKTDSLNLGLTIFLILDGMWQWFERLGDGCKMENGLVLTEKDCEPLD